MSRQRRTEDRGNKWNKRLLRLAAAAFVVMLLGRIFRPAGETFSAAWDGDVLPEAGMLCSGEETAAAATDLSAVLTEKSSVREAEPMPETEPVREAEPMSETEPVPEEPMSAAKTLPEAGLLTDGGRVSGHGTWESVEAYYRDTYTDGNSRAFYADLTHDGRKDLVVLETWGDASDYTLEARVTVAARDLSGEVYTLYERQLDQSHGGWGWLYLYEENGKDYLVEYDPVLYEGFSRYEFSVFYLSAEGEAVPLTGDVLEFEWDGELGKSLEDQIRALNQSAFAYMEQSRLIAAIGEEYISGLEVCALGQ